jgi:hypothetical protein
MRVYLYHPRALPGYGTPAFPVMLQSMPGESAGRFEKRINKMLERLAAGGVKPDQYMRDYERTGDDG